MRFDGYFLLSDWLDIPNLHDRASALARWRVREWLFGLREEPPEYFTPGRDRFLTAFALCTWLYRFGLFIGIAVLVYRHTFKALGVVLFAVEIAWFVALPVAREIQEWVRRRSRIYKSRRARITAVVAGAVIGGVFVPLDYQVTTQAMLRPTRTLDIYAPEASILQKEPIGSGMAVTSGTQIVQLFAPELEHRFDLAASRRERIAAQLRNASLDETQQGQLPVLREQLAVADAELKGLEQQKGRLAPVAPFSGVLVDTALDLHHGDPVARNQRLATLVDTSAWEVHAYLEERDLARVSPGAAAKFYAESNGNVFALRVVRIDRDVTRTLPESLLGSAHGGELPTHVVGNAQIPERAIYSVTLAVVNAASIRDVRQLRGHVVIRASSRTLAAEYVEAAAAVIIRELDW